MGTFTTSCLIENNVDRSKSITIPNVMVDTGSELSWISSKDLEKIDIQREKKDLTFVMANGQRITRSVGFAIIRIENSFTIDEVVFAEEGDLILLGARTLEGMNLVVDPAKKKLAASGPLPAAFSKCLKLIQFQKYFKKSHAKPRSSQSCNTRFFLAFFAALRDN